MLIEFGGMTRGESRYKFPDVFPTMVTLSVSSEDEAPQGELGVAPSTREPCAAAFRRVRLVLQGLTLCYHVQSSTVAWQAAGELRKVAKTRAHRRRNTSSSGAGRRRL